MFKLHIVLLTSTEDSPIYSVVAVACEDERSSVVTPTISAASCDELIEESSLKVCGSASQKEQFPLDGDKTVDDKDGETEIGQQQKRDADKEGRMTATTKDDSSKDQQGSHFIFKKQSKNVMPPQAKRFFVEDNDQSDEESEDEWEVIPIDILGFKFEPAKNCGNVVQDDCALEQQVEQGGISSRQSYALKPVPASAFSKMAVFDTPDDQEQAIRSGQLSFVVLSCDSPKAKPTGKEVCSEHENSCDTDNSSTYSSGLECNYMTVPKELFKSLSSADHCVPQNKGDLQMPPVLEKFVSRIEQDDGIINLDSDEDNDEHCKTKTKKRLSQTSENWSDPSPSLQMGSPKDLESESEECVLVEDEVSKDNDVIILSDSEDEMTENYHAEKNIFTPYSLDCGRAGSSAEERNTATLGVERAHMSKHDHKNKKSSRPKVSSQQSTRKFMSSEAEDGDDFPNEGENVLVSRRKKLKTTFCNLRHSSEADSTVSSSVIPRMLVGESISDEPVTLVGEPRNLSQGRGEAIPMARSSLKEKWQLFIRERTGKPASIPSHTDRLTRMMHASSSHSSDNPAALAHPLIPARLLPSSVSVQSMQATSHARKKVFSDWKIKHVPLRKEGKKRTKGCRRPR